MFNVNQNKGFSLELPNGWTVSIQFGGGNYCERRSASPDASYREGRGISTWSSKTAEIAAFKTNWPEARWYSFGRESEGMKTYVEGYQKVEEVLDFISKIRAFPQVKEEEEEGRKELSLSAVRTLADAAWYNGEPSPTV